MTTDFRALCAELVQAFEDLRDSSHGVFGLHLNGDLAPWDELIEGGRFEDWLEVFARARAALADEPAVPEGREPIAVAGQPSDEELLNFARNQEPWKTWLHPGGCLESAHCEVADLLSAVLARWGSCQGILDSSAPAPAGKVAEFTDMLNDRAARLRAIGFNQTASQIERAAELLQHLSPPQPVPVSERLQQMEDLAADAVAGLRYIEQSHGRLYGVGWDRVYKKADRLKPAHALPVPEAY